MKKEKMEQIENKLSELLKTKSIEEYLKIINENDYLKKYDQIMGKIDNGDYPKNYLKEITIHDLEQIINYLKI